MTESNQADLIQALERAQSIADQTHHRIAQMDMLLHSIIKANDDPYSEVELLAELGSNATAGWLNEIHETQGYLTKDIEKLNGQQVAA